MSNIAQQIKDFHKGYDAMIDEAREKSVSIDFEDDLQNEIFEFCDGSQLIVTWLAAEEVGSVSAYAQS